MKTIEEDSSEEKKSLSDLYVRSANSITSKSTWAYMLQIVVCITAVMALYNEYLSFTGRFVYCLDFTYDKEFRLQEYNRLINRKHDFTLQELELINSDLGESVDKSSITNHLVGTFVDSHVKTQFFDFPVIGITVATMDIISVLSICIILVCLWCYACLRNENLVIGKVLRRTQDYPIALKKYILSGIGFANVFFPISYRNKPYGELNDNDSVQNYSEVILQEKRFRKNIFTSHRVLAATLFCLPVIVVFAGLVLTHFDSHFPKLYRTGAESELLNLANKLIHYNSGIIVVEILMAIVLVFLIVLYVKSIRYSKATSDILFEYKASIKYVNKTHEILELLSSRGHGIKYRLKVEEVSRLEHDEIRGKYLYSLYTNPTSNLKNIIHIVQNYKPMQGEAMNEDLRTTFLDRLKELEFNERSRKWHRWYCVMIEFES